MAKTMKPRHSFMTLLSILCLTFFPFSISSDQVCQKTCSKQPIKYPFGTGPGCGDPRFHPHVTCNDDGQLTFKTHTGHYPVTSIDYNKQVMYTTDPSMSTCACTKPSRGFGLDWDAPFSFSDDTIFALLDCSPESSPIFKRDGENYSTSQLCDLSQGSPVCSLLNSCRSVSRLDIPISTCCVYEPVNLGPSFEMDLQKLKCTSYSGLYELDNLQSTPENWIYGVSIKYKFNFNNDYPEMCANCEESSGVCGYNGPYNSFICNCPNGFNTTTDCYYGSSWNNGLRLFPWHVAGTLLMSFSWSLLLVFL